MARPFRSENFLHRSGRATTNRIYVLMCVLWTCMVTAVLVYVIPTMFEYYHILQTTPQSIPAQSSPSLVRDSSTTTSDLPFRIDTGTIMGIPITSATLGPGFR